MANIPDDTLRKVLLSIQQSAVQSQRQLQVARSQVTVKEREKRIVQLTLSEVTSAGSNVHLYKGVGKMFVMVPQPVIEGELKTQEKELNDDLVALNKKSKFLEKEYNEAQSRLRDIFHHTQAQQ